MAIDLTVVLRTGLIGLGFYLAYLLLMRLTRGILRTIDHGITGAVKRERIRTLSSVISNLLSFGLVILALLLILAELGVSITPLITGLGILGLGFGLAAQTLIKDYISGFFILFENQFNIGDELEIAGKRGRVTELTLRFTVLKGKDGQIYFFPNSQINLVTKFPQPSNH